MTHSLIGIVVVGALVAGMAGTASSDALSVPEATATVAFAITVPRKPGAAEPDSLREIAAKTRSATFSVASAGGTVATAAVDCPATACAGSISAPIGTGKLVAKLYSAAAGTGRLLAVGNATQAITAQTRTVHLTFNCEVASVELGLEHNIIPAASPAGTTTHLLITARDKSGAIIVGPGSYLDRNGKPLVIQIAESSPSNTRLAPMAFAKPMPSLGASNIATVTYSGRAHFHYPTFTVANSNLLSTPSGGVTLTYAPGSGDDPTNQFEPLSRCIGAYPSAGGYAYNGPVFALAPGSGTVCGLPATADLLRITDVGKPYQTYAVNPNHDSSNVQVGFGADKSVYFAYQHAAANSPTFFGDLRRPSIQTSANISAVSQLTLGHDGNLWFYGRWNGKPAIGKLPTSETPNWHPQVVSIPDAESILSMEPGIGNTEAILSTAQGKYYLGTIGADLSGYKRVHIATNASPSTVRVGDLIAGPLNSFYISATVGEYGSFYNISSSGQLSVICRNVQKIYRLSDGTGVGYRNDDLPNLHHAVVHFVPGQGCSAITVFPLEPDSGPPFFDLLGIDSTTDDWIFYSNPTGHRLGVF